MRKKALLFLLTVLLSLPSMARTFKYEYEGKKIIYTVIDEEAKTVETTAGDTEAGNEVSGDIILPSNPKLGDVEYTLIKIGDKGFSGCSGLTSVTIPESVTEIGNSAFYGCSGLTKLIIPDSVTEIGESAFRLCKGLTSVIIGNSVTEIGDSAFEFCGGLTSVIIGNSVAKIGKSAFNECTRLPSIIIPPSVTEIGEKAFRLCEGLTSLIIPDSVTEIGDYAFMLCKGLTSLIIPDSVTEIGKGVFSSCKALTSLIIPDSVTVIGERAFSYCEGLISLIIPDSVTKIGNEAFENCKSLTSFIIPDSVTEIGGSAFSRCSGLTSIIIGNSVTKIGWFTFSNCSSLTSVIIGNSVTSIEGSAFEDCKNLTSVLFGRSVTSIGDTAFYHCGALKKVALPEKSSYYFPSIAVLIRYPEGAIIEDGCVYSPDRTEILFAPTNIEGEFTIPETVTSINGTGFAYCAGLTSVTIPESVYKIEPDAFKGCPLNSLTLYSLPAEGDFSDITSLKEVNYITNDFMEGPKSTFNKTVYSNAILYVKAEVIDQVDSYSPWLYFDNVQVKDWSTTDVTGISLNTTEATMTEGTTLKLIATVTPANATDKKVVWSSSDEEVATVEKGIITAVKPGVAVITATASNGMTATCTVTVEKQIILVNEIILNPEIIDAEEGNEVQISATVLPENATDATLVWSSSDENVATVDQTGKVTIVSPGTAVITATATDDSNVSATCVVNAKAGISSLFDDSPEADVYTANGILLKKCADKNYLSGLAKGIYIIKVAGKVTKKIAVM